MHRILAREGNSISRRFNGDEYVSRRILASLPNNNFSSILFRPDDGKKKQRESVISDGQINASR